MPFLADRALLLAALETEFNERETTDPATDALEVINPLPNPDVTSSRRNTATTTLSPDESIVQRVVGGLTFQMEVKNNGNTDVTVPPRVGRLLRACGMMETQVNSASGCLFRTVANDANEGTLAFDCTTAPTTNIYLKIKVIIVTGGGSGVAEASFEAPAEANRDVGGTLRIDYGDSAAVSLAGSEISITDVAGNAIVGITPDFSGGNPQTGDIYWLHIRPQGYSYTPESDIDDSVTLDLYIPDNAGQSILHRLTGARGTVNVESAVGEFVLFNFEFTGTYVELEDVTTPTGVVLETTIPQVVEYQTVAVAKQEDEKNPDVCVVNWNIDLGNEVNIRDCSNARQSSKGAIITGRDPTMAFDPEVVLTSVEPYWQHMTSGQRLEWWARQGAVDGNTVLFNARNAQITAAPYGDRNNLRTYQIDASLARATPAGNDELEILFT